MVRSETFWKKLVLILCGATVLYLMGSARIPLWDRDEPWYAECSREMLQSGDWVVPTYLTYWRKEKPPLIYWCQATMMKVAESTGWHGPLRGTPDAWAARFPSTAAVVLTGLLIGIVVRHFAGDRRALWATFIFCTSGLTVASSKFAITDGMMLLWMICGQACLALIYSASLRGRKAAWWVPSAFWISLGLAGLTKGPQPVGMHFITLLILLVLDVTRTKGGYKSARAWFANMRWWRELKVWYGLPLLAVIVSPWMILLHMRAPGFLSSLIHRAQLHATGSMDEHGEPPGYHAILIFGTFFPWSILIPTVVSIAFRNRKSPYTRFAMAAAAGPWLLMDLFVKTKLPFYVLPAFPALSFLTADTIRKCARGQYDDLKRPIFMVAAGIWAVAVLGIGLAPWVTLQIASKSDLPMVGIAGFSAICFVYAMLVFSRFQQHKIERASVVMGVGMAMALLVLFGVLFPNFHFLHLSEKLADDLTRAGAYGADTPVAMIGYQEPSLAFYQGGGCREVGEDYLLAGEKPKWPRWMVISQKSWERATPELKSDLRIVAREKGITYNASNAPEKYVYVVENLKPGKFHATTTFSLW